MKRTAIPALMLLTTILLAACGGAALPSIQTLGRGAVQENFAGESIAPQLPAAQAPADQAKEGSSGSGTFSSGDTSATTVDRLVIRNANLSLVVDDPAEAIAKFTQMAERMNGYVVTSNVYQTSYGVDASGRSRMINQANMTLRVPSERLDDALAQIKVAALEVRSETVTGQDVTEQYTDLQSQLRNLESAESQLLQIMQNAQKTEDVLAVFQQLKDVQQQIEVTKGRINYLEGSAKMSEVSLDLIPDVAAEPVQVGPWSPVGTAKSAVRALIQGLQWLADVAIWGAICVLPIGVVVGLPAFFIIRRWVRRRRAGAKEQAPA
jgi:hypothetical protein